ncbi:MAG: beta-lactamase family protein [Spirochaetales bacterium]|nr:beta-lactamase family protein [Spirochaetales bacterium]
MITEGITDITPREAGYNPGTINILDNYFNDLIDRKKIQAAGYLMARHGKIFVHKYMGRLRYDKQDTKFLPGSLRKIASITKMYTATAIMQLVEQGKVYLEQPAANFINEFDTSLHRGITVWHLLTHTAGLKADPGYFLEPYPLWRDIKDMDDLIHFALEGPAQSKPGVTWSYSTIGFVLLGEIISRVTGMPYDEYVDRMVVQPLGMEDTHFRIPGEKVDRVCITCEEEVKQFEWRQEGKDLFLAGGGLTSTLPDQFKMGQMFLNKGTYNNVRILGRKTVEAMTRNQFDDKTTAFCWGLNLNPIEYGAGVSISIGGLMSRFVINHEGYGRCALFADPEEDFVVMFTVPTAIHWAPEIVENPRYIIWSGLE